MKPVTISIITAIVPAVFTNVSITSIKKRKIGKYVLFPSEVSPPKYDCD